MLAPLLLAAALLTACAAPAAAVKTLPTPPRMVPVAVSSDSATSLQNAYVTAVKTVMPSVVQITTDSGLGSGIVLNASGDIVTNAHVVAGATSLTVTNSAGASYPATQVGIFIPDDLAVIHVNGAHLVPATFANSALLQVGDIVLAVGNPLGLQSSVTSGIISALGRTVSEPNGVTLADAIQTSAPINPGNSGGALVDLEGHVVGIPTLAASDPQLGGAASGIGFAISSAVVTSIAGQLASSGHVANSQRAYLGVRLAISYGGAAVVTAVTPGGPAELAGVRAGDSIIAINGTTTDTPQSVRSELTRYAPGTQVTLTVVGQNGSQRAVRVTLGQLPG